MQVELAAGWVPLHMEQVERGSLLHAALPHAGVLDPSILISRAPKPCVPWAGVCRPLSSGCCRGLAGGSTLAALILWKPRDWPGMGLRGTLITVLSGTGSPSFLPIPATGPHEAPEMMGVAWGPWRPRGRRRPQPCLCLSSLYTLGLSPASCCVHDGAWGGPGDGPGSDSSPLFGRNSK